MIQCIYKVDNYDEDKIYKAVSDAFEALKIVEDLKPGFKVLLKPNLITNKSPEFPITTHPLVVKCVAKWLYEQGIRDIVVADSPGGAYTKEYMKSVYNNTQMTMVTEYAKLNDDFGFASVQCPEGFKNHTFNIVNYAQGVDYIINLPKLKTHAMTGYSGGIKNLFGTIPGLQKPQLHYLWPDIEDFSNMLLEIAQVIKPQVTLIDAISAMEGNGPTGGTAYPLGLILASRNLYSQDYVAASIMGIEPTDVVMIRQAMEKGLFDPSEVVIHGDAIPEGLTPFKKPDTKDLDFSTNLPGPLKKPAVWFMKHALKSYPVLKKDLCVGCGKCAESCPAQIIDIKETKNKDKTVSKKAVFKKKGCISCFCCQEMCPMKAIAVKKAL